jgi:hypothetical protein
MLKGLVWAVRFSRQWLQASRLWGGGGLMVWVLENNPHCGFYQHLGGREFTRASVSLSGQYFTEIAYGWSEQPSPP